MEGSQAIDLSVLQREPQGDLLVFVVTGLQLRLQPSVQGMAMVPLINSSSCRSQASLFLFSSILFPIFRGFSPF